MTSLAIVLARGLGTRLRAADDGAELTTEQARVAASGVKAMMPINGRPFLDYVLGSLADAGLMEVALVVAPDHEVLRDHLARHPPERARVSFVVQSEALGTADAILAAEEWIKGRPFLCMNADNLYPVSALRELAALDEPGLPGFSRDDLIASSNIPPDRIQSFALVDVDEGGWLKTIVEKPAGTPAATAPAFGRNDILVSMNLWRFDARIVGACRDVAVSVRGEFELPEAVALALTRGIRFRVFPAAGPVLDLSRRSDAADLERRLSPIAPRP